ncbi:MAG: WbqC family protein [Bacteroidota bacterium]|jgi:hypothetical protein
MKSQTVLLSAHYFPCTAWFRNYLQHEQVMIEQHEHFLKQTYRNRTVILSANGPLALTVPVSKLHAKTKVHEMRIDYFDKWQHRHMEALRSAYNSSPYFLYYSHHIDAFFGQKYETLLELNLASSLLLLKLIKQQPKHQLSESYIPTTDALLDTRELIHPKRYWEGEYKSYLQVFASKYPFAPNLSVLDILFNCGPESTQYILS